MKYILPILIITLSGFLFQIPAITRQSPNEKKIDMQISLGENMFAKGEHLKAIKHLMSAQELARDSNYKEWECLAYYNLGVCYFYMCQNGEALDNFQRAYNIDLELSKNDKKRKEVSKNISIMILNGIASVFFEQGKFDMCRKFVTKAYNMAKKANDPEMIKTLAGDMVLLNNKEKKFNEAEKYLTIARKFAYENCNDLATFDTYEAETRFHQKDYDKVLNLASSIMKNDCASPDNKGLIMIYLINIYSERGEFQKAAAYESEAARLCSLKNKDYLFESLSSMYERSGNLSKALEMKDSMITYHDSVIKLNNQRLVQGANTKLEIIKYKAETEKQIAMIHQRYILWVSGGCILLLILVITLIAINRQKSK